MFDCLQLGELLDPTWVTNRGYPFSDHTPLAQAVSTLNELVSLAKGSAKTDHQVVSSQRSDLHQCASG